MTFILPALEGTVFAFTLTFARAGAMIMLLPVIGDIGVPARVRLAFALAVSAALAPTVAHFYPATAPAPVALAFLVMRETIVGIMVGTMARLIMSALDVAGTLIANQTGLAFAQTFNPSLSASTTVVSTFLSLLGAMLVFESNLHHLAIGAIRGSYDLMPPDGALMTADMVELAVRMVSGSFALGLQLAAPFVLFGFLIYVALGLISRLMPQMQAFFLAMPINILTGFVLLNLFLGVMTTTFLEFFATNMAIFNP
jgi:flagellar biosynthetic protein FliR